MGWLWSSSGGSQDSKNSSSQGTPSPSSTLTPPPPPSQPNHDKPLSRDELAEAEFQSLVSGLSQRQPSENAAASHTLTSDSSSSSSSAASTTASQQAAPSTDSSYSTAPFSIHPRDLVPKEMSCRGAFDYAFFCQSLGGQWVNVYRYGELRSCSERWSDFVFCMRTISYPTEQRERMIADYHRQKLDKYNGKPSSEDVWEMRTVPVQGAFMGDFGALEQEMKVTEDTGR